MMLRILTVGAMALGLAACQQKVEEEAPAAAPVVEAPAADAMAPAADAMAPAADAAAPAPAEAPPAQ